MNTWELIVIPIATGVVSGFTANAFYRLFARKRRLRRIEQATRDYIGEYDVYHWKDLTTPDSVGYRVKITIDRGSQTLRIEQTGAQPVHRLSGEVGLNDSTFQFGEGNYNHPEKTGNPSGRIWFFLAGNGTINVDKYYLDDTTHQPGYEKWQWRKRK